MALIGRIRNNLWMVIVLLGLALVGFLVMDMDKNGSLFGGSPTTMGEIDGKKMDITDFENKVRLRYNSTSADQYTIKNALWNSLINETIVENEAEKLGITITDSELESMIYGPNYSPIIIQDFPAPGQNQFYAQAPDIEQLNQIRDLEATEKLNPDYIPFWQEEKERVKRDRMQTKLTNLVSKSIYTPTWMVKMQHNDNSPANFAFVTIPFDAIGNNAIALEDADYQNYLNNNKAKYSKELAQQTLNYVTFDVKPTPGDSLQLRKELESLIPEFKRAADVDDNQIFVESNQGSFDSGFHTKTSQNPQTRKNFLSQKVIDNLFNAEIGTVYGPYIDLDEKEQDVYKVAKLLGKKVVPDSVAARHILRSTNPQDPYSLQAARDTIEMIKGILEAGTITFDSLANKYSEDPGSKINGGDLGVFPQGRMVTEFNNACFFESKEGYKVVETQFGVHLIQVTRQYNNSNSKGIQVAYLQRQIVPSKETTKAKYAEALRFANDNKKIADLKVAAKEGGMDVASTEPVDENGFTIADLGSGESTRSMIKWANGAKVGDVSPTVYRYNDANRFYENKYVVAAKASEDPAGLPSVASMKKTLGNLVMNEKKGEMIASQTAGLNDLSAIAEKYSAKVDSTSVAFSGNTPDPKLVAAVFGLEAGQTTKPIVGANGVYIAQLMTKPTTTEPTDIPSLRKTMSDNLRRNTRALIPALVKEADIEDERSKFF